MTNLVPLRDRLMALRLRTIVKLAEQPDDGPIDTGLLALVANVQTTLVAVEETMKGDGLSDLGDTPTGKP